MSPGRRVPAGLIGNPNFQCQDRAIVKKIIESYKNYLGVTAIKENVLLGSLSSHLTPASKEDIDKIVKWLNLNKATGSMEYYLNVLNSASVIDKYLTSIINHNISRSYFSDVTNNSLTIYKKKDKQTKENYRPVSTNGFSKVYEKFINDSILPIKQTFLSNFVSAYRKQYITKHVLINLLENCQKILTIIKS